MLIKFSEPGLTVYYNSLIRKLDEGDKHQYELYLNNIPGQNDIGSYIGTLETKLNTNPSELDYSYQIKTIKDEKQQRICWIIRLQIFISILIAVINDITQTHEAPKINLTDYKLGIFGSDKPGSDIDVGIQYIATAESNLAELVKIIEDKFMSYGYRTLDFDIEFYGDLLTITKLVDALPVEYLYLSNSEFSCKEFLELLPYCGASVYRNYLHRQGGNNSLDKIRQSFIQDFQNYCETYIEKLMNAGLLVSFNYTQQNLLFSLLRTCLGYSGFSKLFEDVEKYMYPKSVLYNAQNDRLEKYNYQRAEYYKRINTVEDIINNRQELIRTQNKINTSEILSIFSGIGNALIYRKESYVCVPTIIYVVRIMQAKSANAKEKMGNYGYLVSILEQFGYLFRFQENDTKFDKYNTRLIDALNNITISDALERCITNLDTAVSVKLYRHTLKRKPTVSVHGRRRGRKFSQRKKK